MEEIATLYFPTAWSLDNYCRKRFKQWDSWIASQ
jgi:hypothetical protein